MRNRSSAEREDQTFSDLSLNQCPASPLSYETYNFMDVPYTPIFQILNFLQRNSSFKS